MCIEGPKIILPVEELELRVTREVVGGMAALDRQLLIGVVAERYACGLLMGRRTSIIEVNVTSQLCCMI